MSIATHLEKGQYFMALEMAACAREMFPDDVRVAQLYARALASVGRTEDAKDVLEELYEKGERAGETLGLLGSACKTLWGRSDDSSYARRSLEYYLEGYKNSGDYYPGINAATMSLILGEKERAAELAGEIIRSVANGVADYWREATLGEACLLTGQIGKSINHYRKAVNLAGNKYGDIHSSLKQLKMMSEYMEVPGELFDILKPPVIIAFAGHMIDHPERNNPRFPRHIAEAVKKEIAKVLDELNVGIGYCSAACGSDILFIEAMLGRGAEVNVLLPFRKEDFIQQSVGFAGGQWITRFNAALENATSVKYVTEEGYFDNPDLFSFTAYIIQGLSILKADLLETEPTFLAVWDKADMEKKEGGTKDSLGVWPYPNNVEIVDVAEIRARVKPGESKTRSAAKAVGLPEVPAGITRELMCILFADVKGFSKMDEEQTPFFMYGFLRELSNRMKSLEKKPRVLNTWGDAIFAVYKNAEEMVEFALMLNDLVLNTDWESRKLPANLNIRIALHAGPVFMGKDPIISRKNSYGAHINRTARMEPVTEPGHIYASEQFAAKLIVESKDKYEYEYIGIIDLPKSFGTQEIYHIKSKHRAR
jgi:class 3 adenylate cyclase